MRFHETHVHMPTSLLADHLLFSDRVRTQSTTSCTLERFDQIAYCCIATPSVQALGIAQQLTELNCGNTDITGGSRITGVLMVEERLMIHWLEGPADALDAFWAQIEDDPRQHCLVPLLRKRSVGKRLFEGWKMQHASRNEMMAIVRKAKEQINASSDPQAVHWRHAISTLNVLLDGELTACYAPVARLGKALPHV